MLLPVLVPPDCRNTSGTKLCRDVLSATEPTKRRVSGSACGAGACGAGKLPGKVASLAVTVAVGIGTIWVDVCAAGCRRCCWWRAGGSSSVAPSCGRAERPVGVAGCAPAETGRRASRKSRAWALAGTPKRDASRPSRRVGRVEDATPFASLTPLVFIGTAFRGIWGYSLVAPQLAKPHAGSIRHRHQHQTLWGWLYHRFENLTPPRCRPSPGEFPLPSRVDLAHGDAAECALLCRPGTNPVPATGDLTWPTTPSAACSR